jgi:hypothetical protein
MVPHHDLHNIEVSSDAVWLYAAEVLSPDLVQVSKYPSSTHVAFTKQFCSQSFYAVLHFSPLALFLALLRSLSTFFA